MKFCIYFKKTEPEVSFSSEEHIFPAGIGGIQKLPMEYVSHNCNNGFSGMELSFMRNSLIALPRQFVGPGKRGNLNPMNATQGPISLMKGLASPNSIELGYLSLGIPYSISQIKIDINGTLQFISDRSFGDANRQTSEFIKNLGKYNGRYTLFEDKRLSQNELILGLHNGKWYVALSNKDLETKIDNYVQKLIEQNPFDNFTPNYNSEQTRVHQTLQFDDSYFRVCAKIIFNYLAFVKGQQFVLQECFDPLRDWIVNGGENNFAKLTGEATTFSNIPFPDQAHKLFITQVRKTLFGQISFYGDAFETVVKLCDNIEGPFNIEGFICDWQNRQEFSFVDFLNATIEY
ncbi:hypothetical protein [Bacillus sp. FJAT-29937]|uniref:hypothetical protein n=1 Tax=Bacillus sp. FJAT-29937 TaxID=1720553 RepID=UPI000835479B|nr:hypothetical protein [Bacillus sp. FJAT-29937]